MSSFLHVHEWVYKENSHGLRYSFWHPLDVTVSTTYSAFWDWQVDFGPPSLKYFYTLQAKFGISKPVIIRLSHCLLVQICSVSQTTKAKKIVFHIGFCICMISSSIYISTLKQYSVSTCMQNKHTQTHTGSWKCYLKLRIVFLWQSPLNIFTYKPYHWNNLFVWPS